MGYPIYHSQYTAAQIEASIGKTPRIKVSTRTWEIWDIATCQYVDTGISVDSSGTIIQIGTISLSTNWTEASDVYSQTVTVTGATVTADSKVDLQLTAAQLKSLYDDGVASITVENNAGVLTAYAIGAAPSSAMTVQCTVTEVGV